MDPRVGDSRRRTQTMTFDLGILLALACAFVANLGFFYKYRGAGEVPQVSVRHPLRSGRELFSSKWFTLGMIIATASWGLHVAALAQPQLRRKSGARRNVGVRVARAR